MEPVEAIQHVNIIRHFIPADGEFPNNALLPLLIYQQTLHIPEVNPDKIVRDFFETNDWNNAWTDGVYDYHHYHSTAHEVLGIIRGSARIQFGGPNGIAVLLEKGDAVVIPAGVAHKAIDVYDDFTCVGAYPSDQTYDIKTGKEGDLSEATENLRKVTLPIADPVYGTEGPLLTNWKM